MDVPRPQNGIKDLDGNSVELIVFINIEDMIDILVFRFSVYDQCPISSILMV
ncbi:hypothetical protein PM082_004400 [Marasmius tenuissimus]|nr:hypothetical protein PM082_004400 [Marasmius tenuissimus]